MLIPRRIRKRRVLVVLVTASQVLSMLLALWWFSSWLEDHLTAVIREQVLTNNQRITASMIGLLRDELDDSQIPPFDDYGIAEAVSLAVTQMHGALVLVTLAAVYLGAFSAIIVLRRYDDRLLRRNDHLEELVDRRSRSLVNARDALILGLARLAEWRDDSSGGHLDRIRTYVEILAGELSRGHPELDEQTIRMLGVTSSLHDIGKVGIPDSVLLKPGPLDAQERVVIEKHPLIAGNCLMAIKERLGYEDPFLRMACEIALCHHERWDGSGYPYGLAGERIPISARIVALADAYDALTSERVYKKELPHDEARRIIAEDSGSHFDPEVVVAFLACDQAFKKVRRGQVARREVEELEPVGG